MEIKGISGGQMRMIYGLARKAGLDNDALHDVVRGATRGRASSIKALTSYQAKLVIDRLQRLTGDAPAEPPAGRASAAQRGKILSLTHELGWAEEPARLRGFLKARFGVSDLSFLPYEKVGAVIEALKAIEAGGRSERRRHDG